VEQAIDIVGVRIFAQTTSCAHSCRYCLVEGKRHTKLPFSRFSTMVERFAEWRQARDGVPFSILAGYGDSYELDVETLKNLFDLLKKIGIQDEARNGIKLGGLKWRSEDEMRAWLRLRRDDAGLKIIHASFVGHGSVHDGWNGREGDFEFLLQTMRTAASLGLQIRQRLFVVNSTLPSFDRLLAALDLIPCEPYRYLSTFVYHGLGSRYEEERITEVTRDRLPKCITSIPRRDGDLWLSEREWIAEKKSEIASENPERRLLDLELTEANIAFLETISCEEIIDFLTKRTQQSLQPSPAELCERYADRSNRRVYASLGELIHKWRNLHKLRLLKGSPVNEA
jgi:hypothetical protein